MQSIERCTGGCTTLYAVRACCTVCNMQAERFCEAMKPIYGMSIAFQVPIFFGSGTALISESSEIASQRRWCQERPSLRFKSTAKFLFQTPSGCIHNNGERRKVDRKGTSARQIS